jgi:hypothetical protein
MFLFINIEIKLSTFWPMLGGAQTQWIYTSKWVHHLITYNTSLFQFPNKRKQFEGIVVVTINNARAIEITF